MSEGQAWSVQLLFGLVYNRAIGRGLLRNLEPIQVVLGMLGVLLIAATVRDASIPRLAVFDMRLSNAQHAVWFLFKQLAFAGTPMVLGSLWRYWQRL